MVLVVALRHAGGELSGDGDDAVAGAADDDDASLRCSLLVSRPNMSCHLEGGVCPVDSSTTQPSAAPKGRVGRESISRNRAERDDKLSSTEGGVGNMAWEGGNRKSQKGNVAMFLLF